jgi:hypothetical protein
LEQAHHDSLAEEQINELMEAVRFRWLSYEQLEEVTLATHHHMHAHTYTW